jgi:hypothetical protein
MANFLLNEILSYNCEKTYISTKQQDDYNVRKMFAHTLGT